MAKRNLRTITEGTTTAFWLEAEGGDANGAHKRDMATYETYRPEDDPRLYCDRCARCLVYKCTGLTAVHHFIHMDEEWYFNSPDDEFEDGLLPDSNWFKHSDRNSGV